MPSPTGFTSKIQGKIFAVTPQESLTGTGDWADVTSARGTDDANQVLHITSIDPIGGSPNEISLSHYDEQDEQNIPGQGTRDSWSFTFNLKRSNAKHRELILPSARQKNYSIVYVVRETDTAQDAYIIQGRLNTNNINPAEGEAENVTITISISSINGPIAQA